MQIVIAPQAFKGTLSAREAAQAIAAGVKCIFPKAKIALLPVADGGDGLLDVLVSYRHGILRKSRVTGADGRPVFARWGVLPNVPVAVIEMAQVCGLARLPKAPRHPGRTTTYGLGELIRRALDRGWRRFIIGVGGSATNDGGAGMAQALGAKLLDKCGHPLPRGGAALSRLHHIDISEMDPRIQETEFRIACDVSNPLLGPKGASRVYAPQKGATSSEVEELEQAMRHYAVVIGKDLGIDVRALEGGGAGGGTGAGLAAFLGARLERGIDLVLEAIQFEHALAKADLVITGEGCMDLQTLHHKAPLGVAKMAKAHGLPVIAIVGSVGKGFVRLHQEGIDAIMPTTFFAAQPAREAFGVLVAAAEEALRLFGLECKRR